MLGGVAWGGEMSGGELRGGHVAVPKLSVLPELGG